MFLSKEIGGQYAVITFNGKYDVLSVKEKLASFLSSLKLENISFTDEWKLARYNSPFTISYFRTNELWVKLA